MDDGLNPVVRAVVSWNTFHHVVTFLAWVCGQWPTPFASLLRVFPARSVVLTLSYGAALGDPADPLAALCYCLRTLLVHVLVHYARATADRHGVLVLWVLVFVNLAFAELMVTFPESNLCAGGVFVLGATFNLLAICVALPTLAPHDIAWAVCSGLGYLMSATQPPHLRVRVAGASLYGLGTVHLCNRMRLFAADPQL